MHVNSTIDFHILNSKVRNRCKSIENECKRTHSRKLHQIGFDQNHRLDPNKVVINLSNVSLTKEQIETLALGLDYALPPTKIQREKHLLDFGNLAQILKHQSIRKGNYFYGSVILTYMRSIIVT